MINVSVLLFYFCMSACRYVFIPMWFFTLIFFCFIPLFWEVDLISLNTNPWWPYLMKLPDGEGLKGNSDCTILTPADSVTHLFFFSPEKFVSFICSHNCQECRNHCLKGGLGKIKSFLHIMFCFWYWKMGPLTYYQHLKDGEITLKVFFPMN